jgi:hypothetical protein
MFLEEFDYRRFEVFQLAPPRAPLSGAVVRLLSPFRDGLRIKTKSASNLTSGSLSVTKLLNLLESIEADHSQEKIPYRTDHQVYALRA